MGFHRVCRTLIAFLLCSSLAFAQAPNSQQTPPPPPMFTPQECAQIVAYWQAPGRLAYSLPADSLKHGPWQVRLTPDGSKWLWNYQIAIGAAAAPPTQQPTQAQSPYASWKAWVQAKIAWDRYQAQKAADAANAALGYSVPKRAAPPPFPGPIPPDLLAACGDPPPFANAVTLLQTTVTFDDGVSFTYQDNIDMPPAYAYYRFPQGTDTAGISLKAMPPQELQALFDAAHLTPEQAHVLAAVSPLEGGFDAINTYDTGYVSIGFLQFITAANGKGDLMPVLLREKSENPSAFQNDFHRFGVDVTPDGTLDVVDPDTGAELVGADAVMKVIADRRLTAVFQRAGRLSTPFRVAQIETAIANYWPADFPVTVQVNGQTLTGKVSDVIHSEAGLATLFDRQVNRGNINPFPTVLARVMQEHNLTSIADAAAYEQEIVAKCRYRSDFLKNPHLSQPPPLPSSTTDPMGK
jgi:hypothetical protein